MIVILGTLIVLGSVLGGFIMAGGVIRHVPAHSPEDVNAALDTLKTKLAGS